MSAQLKAAKDALELAVTDYKHSTHLIKRCLNVTPVNERSLTIKIKALTDSLAKLNTSHTIWVKKAGLTEDQLAAEDYSTIWLENEWANVDDIQLKVDEILSSDVPAPRSGAVKLDVCNQQMQTLQQSINSKTTNLTTTLANDKTMNQVTLKLITDMLDSVKSSLSSEFSVLSEEIMSLDHKNVAARCKEFEDFRRAQLSLIDTIQMELAQKTIIMSTATPRPNVIKSIEMEKSKAPFFSGKTLEYPEFKRGWQKVAGVCWTDGNQIEQIKFKVDPATKRVISRCSTMDEVWTVLDAEYAQEEDVINAVDVELKELRMSSCSISEYFVKLRNHLPNLEEALKGVNGLDHLCSPARVNYLCTKFDDRTLHDWDYFRSKSSGNTYERFFKFLVDQYDAAKSSIARANKTMLNDELFSNQFVNLANVGESICRRCQTFTARDGVYTCPGCGRGTANGENIMHCLEHCGAYMRMSPNERSACVETANWCPVHLLGTHSFTDCNQGSGPRFVCGMEGCSKHHHKSLHGSTTSFVANIHSTQHDISANHVLLSTLTINTAGGNSLNCMFDNCSTCCLISKKAADRLNLRGKNTNILITTVTGTKVVESFSYSVPLLDKNNKCHYITAYEIESISNDISANDISGVKHLFSSEVQCKWDSIKNRPTGAIEVLIGNNVLGIHPRDFECRGNLKVSSSLFGCGYILTGSHPAINSCAITWNEDVSAIRHSAGTSSPHVVNRLSVMPNYNYFEHDNLGIQPPKRCDKCQGCKDCSFRGHKLSQQEQYEQQVLESKVEYDPALQSFSVSYPFAEDPAILPNNIGQVIKIAEREEKKLEEEGFLDEFNLEFDKMIRSGALSELTKEELEMWDGPAHYVSLQHVLNDASATTPFRIVTNSSLSDRNGVSVNSITMKGAKSMSDQWSVLTQWRAYEVSLCSDVTKAYYSLRTGEVEKHIRRVVWRYGKKQNQWRVFGFCTVSFGDRPAAAFLEIVIRRTAEMNKSIDPLAAYRIVNDRYVDDFATGGTPTEVSRFVGNECDDFQCNGTLPTILSKGSLHLKVLVTSGETNLEKIKKLGGKVLGLGYNPCDDTIIIEMTASLRINKRKEKIILSPENINSVDHKLITPRNMLGVVNGIYDPLGLVTPITIRLRIAFRELFQGSAPIEWDSPITFDASLGLWLDLLHLIVNADNVTFMRATKPVNAVSDCQLICFFDGSDLAYGASIYIRWTLDDDSVFVTILCAKSHVTPLHRISTPRSELNGAVIAARLVLSAVESLSSSNVIIERVWMIGDSECTLASLEKVNCAFGEYFGNRVGEILEQQAKIEKICPVGHNGEWWHTDSHTNAADRLTRLDSAIEDVDRGSEWQSGPSFLKQPPLEWPITRGFAERKEDYIPQIELLKRFRCLIKNTEVVRVPGIHKLIDPFSTNSWEKLVRKTQLLVYAFNGHKFPSMEDVSTIKAAKRVWFISAMEATQEALKAGKLKELDIRNVDGMKVVYGRASTGLQKFFGKNYLPVLMGNTRVAYLIMLNAHCKDHTGRDVTMAMSRFDAWIINGKKLAKKIVRSCIRCRFLRKLLEGQKMAALPPNVQGQSPPFTNIGLDLSGPITVKSMTNKRSTMKVWVVIFLCLNTKAVSMELAPGYATKDFLLAYDGHVHIRGEPSFVHSDRGSQLVSAHSNVAEETLRYDWDEIAASTAASGTTWKFAPAGAQWRNGAVESFVKKFKRSFLHLYQDTKFNFAELAVAVRRIANILNHRPVSVQRTKSDSQDEDFLSPLTPNMLLTWRNGSGPPREYLEVNDPQTRLSFIEELETAWWYQYKVQYFDSLVPTRKWIDENRNLAINDIVLIKYTSKSAPGTYRLGRVSAVELDDDNLVRTCTVKYNLIKPINSANRESLDGVMRKEIRVPVQRLVLILPAEEQ